MKTTPKKFDSKPVYDFLKSIDDFQFSLLRSTINIAHQAQSVIKDYKISKQEFCAALKIKPAQYTNFVKGNFNYGLKDIVYLNCLIQKKIKEQVDKTEYVMELAKGNPTTTKK